MLTMYGPTVGLRVCQKEVENLCISLNPELCSNPHSHGEHTCSDTVDPGLGGSDPKGLDVERGGEEIA